jgi:hypothetical protein
MRNCLATWRFSKPSAQLSTMRARKSMRYAVFGRRAHCSNFARSSALIMIGLVGLPNLI